MMTDKDEAAPANVTRHNCSTGAPSDCFARFSSVTSVLTGRIFSDCCYYFSFTIDRVSPLVGLGTSGCDCVDSDETTFAPDISIPSAMYSPAYADVLGNIVGMFSIRENDLVSSNSSVSSSPIMPVDNSGCSSVAQIPENCLVSSSFSIPCLGNDCGFGSEATDNDFFSAFITIVPPDDDWFAGTTFEDGLLASSNTTDEQRWCRRVCG